MWKWIRRLLWLILLVVLAGAGFVAYDWTRSVEIPEMEIPGKLAQEYVEAGDKEGVPWPYLAAMDEVDQGYEKVSRETILKQAAQLKQKAGKTRLSNRETEKAVQELLPPSKAEQVIDLARSYEWAASPMGEEYVFPFRTSDRDNISYGDTWGASRSYGGERPHEGTDVMASKGIPIRSVGDGRIISKGWNTLGGWRITIMDERYPQISFYYAHLERYAEGLEQGQSVKKGQVIGYVGDSGYGPEGTTGQFDPHLHFGAYVRKSRFTPMREAINPYAFLKAWEAKSD